MRRHACSTRAAGTLGRPERRFESTCAERLAATGLSSKNLEAVILPLARAPRPSTSLAAVYTLLSTGRPPPPLAALVAGGFTVSALRASVLLARLRDFPSLDGVEPVAVVLADLDDWTTDPRESR